MTNLALFDILQISLMADLIEDGQLDSHICSCR